MTFLRSLSIYVFHAFFLYWDVFLLFYILNSEYVANFRAYLSIN